MKKTVLKDLAPIAIPHGPPVEACGEYFRSKMEDNKVCKYPVWDVARPTPQVLVQHARRDLMAAEERLQKARLAETRSRAELDHQWEELRNKEMQLKQSFISFNKFVRENQEKRERAERKMKEDLATLDRKTKETDAMRRRVVEMEEIRRQMEKQIHDYAMYENFLSAVLQQYPEFKQPIDVLNRYEALAAAKSALALKQRRDLETLEGARAEMAKLAEDKRLVIMGLNNTLASLRIRYDRARSRVMKWDLALSRLKTAAAKRMTELSHVRDAIWTLYLKICDHKGMEVTLSSEDFESQLVVIMRALVELRRIVDIARKRVRQTSARRVISAVKTK